MDMNLATTSGEHPMRSSYEGALNSNGGEGRQVCGNAYGQPPSKKLGIRGLVTLTKISRPLPGPRLTSYPRLFLEEEMSLGTRLGPALSHHA